MPFSNCPFPISNYRFFLFSGPFWTVRKFLPSWSETQQLADSNKKNFFLLINLIPIIPSFYIRIKFRLKNCETTVHLAHFFIHVFEGEICGKLKNIHLGKPPLILKKFFLICLHSSTLVYIRLHSPTFVQTNLHSSTFVYTRLHLFRLVQ